MYNGALSTNLIARIAPVIKNFNRFAVYYPYTVKEGERPDTIAYDYYGSSEYAWLVMIVNDVYDYYTHWPLTTSEFYDYLRKKYGEVYELNSVIHHYVYTGNGEEIEEIERKSWWMTPDTFNLSTEDEQLGWSPVSTFQYELDVNESKRNIRLISNEMLSRVDRELSELFTNGAE
jgi:hypothetical protein